MDDVMDDMDVLDAHEAYGNRKAEFDAASSEDAPMPTVVSLEDEAPMPTVVSLDDAKAEASPVDARARMHELANAYKQQIHQDVQRMAKEMGVSYEDLFAAVGGQTAGNTVKAGAAKVSEGDEPETKAEKKAEAQDPQAEQKEPEHKPEHKQQPAPTPVKRQEHTAPAAPRSQDSRQSEFSKQAAEAMMKSTAAGTAPGPEHKMSGSQRKVETPAPAAHPAAHPPSRFHKLPNQAAAEYLGVPKAERVREYEHTGQSPVPLAEMGDAVGRMGGDFVRGAKGIGRAASQFVDTLLHPYGRGGEEDRRLEAARKKAHGKGGGGEEGGSGSSESEGD